MSTINSTHIYRIRPVLSFLIVFPSPTHMYVITLLLRLFYLVGPLCHSRWTNRTHTIPLRTPVSSTIPPPPMRPRWTISKSTIRNNHPIRTMPAIRRISSAACTVARAPNHRRPRRAHRSPRTAAAGAGLARARRPQE